MYRGKLNRLLLAAMLLLTPALGTSASHAQATTELPERCSYIYASATHRMAAVMVGLVNRADAYTELRYAQDAVQLSINLDCPKAPMLKSIDCAIDLVKRQQGTMLDVTQSIQCVEESTGQPFPRFSDPG